MFFLLKSEVLSGNGLGREILKRAGGLHPDVLELMADLEVVVKNWQAEKRAADAAQRATAKDFQRVFR